ncbi:hypothetical protein F4821DRAFT_280793 [Hypoxylon rubiginosum]|uniref:Uncharacterized protein n=1 Tax=Hypoxylon rubiginosum TaxID=110542 RepID=A0ACC0DG85_9PEZI|nr:hypothetical protein F4821DRAFT_280793 [Hypoxylon rubiginosum]
MHSNIPLVVVIAAWVSLATTHVVEEYPPPFRFLEYGPTNPIDPTGSNFPCKVPEGSHLQLDGEPTVMAIGEEQYVSFSGKAVHGGGSCQLALSGPVSDGFEKYDLATAKWKVIHSIEGGCPARHQPGNLDGPNKDKYPFKIPEGIEPGNHIFSWTWLARIGGQPEYYQNCAPITVTLPRAKKSIGRRTAVSKRVDFPELFMANIGEKSGGCTTGEALRNQVAIAFPDPGLSVDHPEGTQNLFQQQCDGNPRARQGQGQGQRPNDSPPPVVSAPQPGNTATTHVSSIASSTTLSTVSMPSVAPSSTPEPTSTPTSDTDPTQATSPSTETCTEGQLTCLDGGTHFATCTGGHLTPPQLIAPGFRCRPGAVGLDISPA